MFGSVAREGRKVERALRRRLGVRAMASTAVPRPRLRAKRRRPGLTDVVVSSDLNPRYLGAWETARTIWSAVGGVRPHLVLVARADEVPAELAADPDVHVFEPMAGLHTAFQAQCIRLLYPALLDTAGAVLTSDVDMVPLSRRFFHEPLDSVDESHFVAYRDALLKSGEIPISYNAAIPRVWADVFDVRSPEDVGKRLVEWGTDLEYDGTHGGRGWHTDQVMLYRTLIDRGRTHRDVWILRDAYSGYERLQKVVLQRRGHLVDAERDRIRRGVYADFHVLVPYEEHRELNDEVIGLATGGLPSR